MLNVLILIIAGCVGGFLTGFVGIGGNTIFVPVLDFILRDLGVQGDGLVKSIIANSLFITIFTGGIVSLKQYRIGNFFPREVAYIAVSGIISAWFVTYLIKQGSWYSREKFNLVFTIMLIPLILKLYLDKKDRTSEDKNIQASWLICIGLGVGVITSFSGLGGGIVMIPLLTDGFKLNIKKAASISTGVVPFFAASVCFSYMLENPDLTYAGFFRIGYVDFLFAIPLAVGAYLLSPVGVKVAQKSNQKTIRFTFATVLAVLLTKMLYELFIVSS
ncbi:sulfite exporter TauE/SafE family protein [Leptospira sp. 'Mane']|uniref:sulfite exporter TauE/SafE family protein n=1 Tax=Leptospira sp. 'Mane' TaxID=3387407 RepID=UPI00398B7919